MRFDAEHVEAKMGAGGVEEGSGEVDGDGGSGG